MLKVHVSQPIIKITLHLNIYRIHKYSYTVVYEGDFNKQK